jgi:hypothetical protein
VYEQHSAEILLYQKDGTTTSTEYYLNVVTETSPSDVPEDAEHDPASKLASIALLVPTSAVCSIAERVLYQYNLELSASYLKKVIILLDEEI